MTNLKIPNSSTNALIGTRSDWDLPSPRVGRFDGIHLGPCRRSWGGSSDLFMCLRKIFRDSGSDRDGIYKVSLSKNLENFGKNTPLGRHVVYTSYVTYLYISIACYHWKYEDSIMIHTHIHTMWHPPAYVCVCIYIYIHTCMHTSIWIYIVPQFLHYSQGRVMSPVTSARRAATLPNTAGSPGP